MRDIDGNGHVPGAAPAEVTADDVAPVGAAAGDPAIQLAEIRGYLRCLAEYSAADLERLQQMRRELAPAPPSPPPGPPPPRWWSIVIVVIIFTLWVLAIAAVAS